MRLRRNHAIVLVLMLGLWAAGCKEGNPLTGGISPADAGFVQESRPAVVTDHYVWLRESSVNGGRIALDIVVSEVDELVTGIALKLTYPDLFSKFAGCSDGVLFPPGGCYFSEPAPGSGVVFVSRSITAPDQSTTVSGDQVVVRVEFIVFGVGEGPIVIEAQNLGGGDASALLDVDGDPILVHWYSGTLRGE